jgi:hypothetical protein
MIMLGVLTIQKILKRSMLMIMLIPGGFFSQARGTI